MKNVKHLFKSIYKTVPALLILITIYIALSPETAFAFTVNSPAAEIETINQDDFDKKFREGRDLIDKEEWTRAADKFREVIEKYPNNKSADAAFYWLAFCHKKQKQFKEANAALNSLLEKFPASSWANDARVMKLEIGQPLGLFSSANALQAQRALTEIYSAAPVSPLKGSAAVAPQIYLEGLANSGVYTTAAPLDRADEIRIAAFQSLLAADTKRAIETMGEILKPDSKASESLKQEVLRVLRSPRSSSVHTTLYAASGSCIGKEFAPLLRETLIKSFQNETNLKIRKAIIYALAHSADEGSIDHLKKLYAAENDREIKKAVINSFAGSSNVFYRFNSNSASASASAPKRKIESDFLFELVRAEPDAELRRLAFSSLQRFPGWAASEQAIETMARLYDAETDEAFKISLIRALANAKQNQATRKLLDIAKNDRSDKLKLEAIYSLRTSKNPEVLKFLEDLIK
jgi:hypothetical protein